jgi:nitroreductase
VSTPSGDLCRRLVEVACLAPSVGNSQPWQWRILGTDALELSADRTRQQGAGEADARNLALSCGAALHHGIVAARALGLTAEALLLPTPAEPDLLAHIHFFPGTARADALETLDLIGQRRTDRRRFTTWPIPHQRLGRLVRAGCGWGAYTIPVVDVATRHHTELLLARALRLSRSTDRDDGDGDDHGIEGPDGLLFLCTAEDDQRAWLQAGQALSALWLAATRDGLSIVPLSQVIENEETRLALHHEVFAGMASPQLLVRVGWQEISHPLPLRTPRRSLADVLLS